LKQRIDGFYKNTSVILISQITETPAFPKAYVKVTLGSKVYKVHKERETDALYDTRLALNSENLYPLIQEYSLRTLFKSCNRSIIKCTVLEDQCIFSAVLRLHLVGCPWQFVPDISDPNCRKF